LSILLAGYDLFAQRALQIEPNFRSGRVNPRSLASVIGRRKRVDLPQYRMQKFQHGDSAADLGD